MKTPNQIILRPVKTDYATFARTQAISLGFDPDKAAKRKPNAYFLSLMMPDNFKPKPNLPP